MIPVSSEKHYHGFDYTQVYRGTRSCLYRQTYQGKTVGFEVFIITNQPETILNGTFYPARERWPKDEDFGKTAWSFFSLKEASIKMNQLETVFSNITRKSV